MLRNKLNQMAVMAAAAMLLASTQVHAALPELVTTEITTAKTDISTLLQTLTAAGVVIWVASVIYGRFRVK